MSKYQFAMLAGDAPQGVAGANHIGDGCGRAPGSGGRCALGRRPDSQPDERQGGNHHGQGEDPAPAAGSLRGAIALVSRGGCPYGVKASRAREAGAIGIVIAENRPGDPTYPFITALTGGEISDLDGSRIRAAAASSGGAVTVRFTRDVLEVPTTWAGVPTSFTSSGLTPFGLLRVPATCSSGTVTGLSIG